MPLSLCDEPPAIRAVARQAGERAVELYLADLAESEWMREKSPESLT
jgi:hypothetical protein